MPDDSTPSNDPTDEPSASEAALIGRLAALDDRLGGHDLGGHDLGGHDLGGHDLGGHDLGGHDSEASARTGPCGDATAADGLDGMTALTEAVDVILLLRQVAAADRESGREPLILPQRIGRYEILREAGRGAFAYVLEARDEILRRQVALKVARPEVLVSVPFRRRFIREAELAARLMHPHIVSIHEVGESGGLVFIASEYCAGGDLADWLERHPGPVPPRQAAEIVRTLATAVTHAHANGVIHRDIKPANVLLVPPPNLSGMPARRGETPLDGMTVKVGDFGLGKIFHDHDKNEFTQLTRTGSRLGTPRWMAPEQIDRSFGAVGPATDIHALGLLLDRMLTGRCIFAGMTEAEIFRAVLLEDVIPADRAAPHVPRDLAAVCLKCRAKRPADRYASATELTADLSRFLANRPTLARPLSPPARVARWIVRRPLLTLLAAVAVGGIVLAGWATFERSRESTKRAQGQAEIVRLEAAAELRRGFESWRSGNAAAAIDHLRASAGIDAGLAGSLAGSWLLGRLHGEHDLLLEPQPGGPPRPDFYCCGYSRDGKTLAAGGADGRLVLLPLNAAGGVAGPPLQIQAHDEVNDVAFSHDGHVVASAGEDGRLCLWNVADGTLVREAHRSDGPLFAAAFSPSGTVLACGGGQQSLTTLSIDTPADPLDLHPRDLHPFAAAIAAGSLQADADIEAISFVAEDQVAVACGKLVALIDLLDGSSRFFSQHDGTVGQVAVTRDATRLLSGGTDREPLVWDIATGRLLLSLPRHPGWIQGGDFSPDGASIATGCRDGVVRIFDASTGAERRKLVGHIGRTWDVKYDPVGMVVSAGADGTVRRWNLAAAPDTLGMREVRIPGLTRSAERQQSSCGIGILETTAGKRAALISLEGRTLIVDATTGTVDTLPAADSQRSYNLAIDSRRHRFAAVPMTGPIELHSLPRWNADGTLASAAPTAAFTRLPGIEQGAGKDVAWTPAGMLIAGCDGGRLLAWNASLDRAIEVDRLERTVDAVKIAPAGPARLAIAAGKLLRVYSLPASGPPRAENSKTLLSLPEPAGPIVKLAWSPDGQRLAYGTYNGHVATIDATTGRTIVTFPKHAREVTGLGWSADARTLVTADAEGVRFSDIATTMTFDEVRPGWTIENIALAVPGNSATGHLLVIAGSAVVAPGGTDREARVGIFDLRHSLSAVRKQP